MKVAHWKALGVCNLTDARYFNALENAWITFDFDALNPQAVTLQQCKDIMGWLHEPTLVASFGHHQEEAEIEFILNETSITHVEVTIDHPMAMDEDFCKTAFLSVFDDEIEDALEHPYAPFAWIIDVALTSPKDGKFVKQLKQLQTNSLVFIHTSVNAEEIIDWLKTLPDVGIQIDTDAEEKPGFSSVDVYNGVIEKVLEAAANNPQ